MDRTARPNSLLDEVPLEDMPLDDLAARLGPAAFAREQKILENCWTFLGFAGDLANTNDWITASIGGRPVVVQRFETGLRGFENRCRHRGYPLRTEAKGNGPLVCGFHHWRYNADGLALGIPECPAMFGKTPRELDARLERVEIAECGPLVFGRFGDGPSLEAWLGPAFPILGHMMSLAGSQAGLYDRSVQSNWRYMMDISLDDYHIVAVHPTTFGKNGYIPDATIHYERFGAHSTYMPGAPEGALAAMAEACRAGTYRPQRYRIFQIFPNLIVSMPKSIDYLGDPYWYIVFQTLTPEAHDRTRFTSRFFPVRHTPAGPVRNFLRSLAMPTVNAIFKFYGSRVHTEDNEACEKQQRAARPGDPPPFIAKQEQRIAWFSESYARVMAGEHIVAD